MEAPYVRFRAQVTDARHASSFDAKRVGGGMGSNHRLVHFTTRALPIELPCHPSSCTISELGAVQHSLCFAQTPILKEEHH